MEKLNKIPEFFIEKLENQYGKEITNQILDGFNKDKKVTIRINTLKANKEEILTELKNANIDYEFVNWYEDALVINNAKEFDLQNLEIYKDGKIYLQSLSSMLPPLFLEPKEGSDILDMCAAPGGKTSQISALTNNKSNITACEMNNIRYERLKYNMEKLGVKNINIMKKDSRILDDFFAFDNILLDAPCSGSGTINFNDDNTYKNFSLELVNKTCKLQRTLLNKAVKLLKKGNTMIYSTCSILQEENEDIVQNVLNQNNVEVVPIEMNEIPVLPSKIEGAICVMPNELFEGFFVVKLRKIK